LVWRAFVEFLSAQLALHQHIGFPQLLLPQLLELSFGKGLVAYHLPIGVTIQGSASQCSISGERGDPGVADHVETDLDLAKLNSMTSRARLDDVPALAAEILAGKTRGRVVIDL